MNTSKIRITLRDDREIDFEGAFCLPVDQIQFERRFGVTAQLIGSEASPIEWTYFLIFRTAAREVQEFAEMSFDDFMEELASFEFVGEAATSGNPTEPEAPTG